MRISSRLDIPASGSPLVSPLLTAGSQEGYSYDPDSPPPAFGLAAKKYWAFEDGYVNVNHGEHHLFPYFH